MKKFLLSLLCFAGLTATAQVTDVLTAEAIGVTGTNSYGSYNDIQGSASSAIYSANCAKNSDGSLQLRSNNNNSGIVSTVSGGTLSRVVVEWDEATGATRELNIYGSNTAYTAPSDLYGANAGTLLGTLKKGNNTQLVVEGDYEYVGIRSKSGALYLTKVEITWNTEAPAIAKPTISPASGTYMVEGDVITMACSTEGAKIYYTLDGTEPTAASTLYTAPIEWNYDIETVKAVSVKDDLTSDVVTATYYALPVLEGLGEVNDVDLAGTQFIMAANLTVVYKQSKTNLYVADSNGTTSLLYKGGADFSEINAGDVILGGWRGKIDKYNQIPEIVPDNAEDIVAEGTATLPAPIAVDEENAAIYLTAGFVNAYVKIAGVTFNATTPGPDAATNDERNFDGKLGELNVHFFNNFRIESVEAGTYDVTGFVAVYAGNVQVYPMAIEEPTVEENHLYACGGFCGWNPENSIEFTYDEGTLVYTLEIPGTVSELKISTVKGDWNAFNASALTVDEPLENATWSDLVNGDSNIALPWPGVYTIKVNLENMMIWVGTETPAPSIPETLGVIGAIEGGEWTTTNVAMLAKSGNTFSGDVVMTGGWFSFCEHAAETEGDWTDLGTRYGAETDGTNVESEVATPFFIGSNAFKIVLPEGVEYPQTFTFNVSFDTNTFTIKHVTTGLEVVDANNDGAVYYNLQGVRVSNPSCGVYIRVAGDKAVKVLVK